MKKNLHRRDFVRTSAAASVAFTIIPRSVLGKGFIPPSDKINIAYIGCGTQGLAEMCELIANPSLQIVSVCDPNKFSTDYIDWNATSIKGAADAYNQLLEYSKPSNVSVAIENHGGVSNDSDWMVELMKKVNDPFFGTYPDWRRPAPDFDNYAYLEKTLPYAKGMSYRNQPDDALTIKMIELSKRSYRGWYGIESSGREEIKKGIAFLKKHLLNQS